MDLLPCNWWHQRNHTLALNNQQLQALWSSAWGQRRIKTGQDLLKVSGAWPSDRLSLSIGFINDGQSNYLLANWPNESGHLYCHPEKLPFADASVNSIVLGMFLAFYPQPTAVLADVARSLAEGGQLICLELYLAPKGKLVRRLFYRDQAQSLARASAIMPWSLYWQARKLGLSVKQYKRQSDVYMLVMEKRRPAMTRLKRPLAVPA